MRYHRGPHPIKLPTVWLAGTLTVFSFASAASAQANTAVVPLSDLTAKLRKEGWVPDTALPSASFFVPDKADLAAGVQVDAYWIVNTAYPGKSAKLRKGVAKKLTLGGLSIEDQIAIALPGKSGKDVILKLCKNPVGFDALSEIALGLTFNEPATDKEIKIILVEAAVRIRIGGVERLYFTGSSSVMAFEKEFTKKRE